MTTPRHRRADLWIGAAVGTALMITSFFVVPAGSDPAADCRHRVDLEISSSTEKVALVKELATRYEQAGRVVDGRCANEVTVDGLSSGLAKNALAAGWKSNLPRPQVWLPTSSMWPRLLEHEGKGAVLAGDSSWRSVTASTLVIAMPKAVADTLKEAGAPLDTWADVFNLARSPAGWAAYGRPEWGRFLLGRDNPEASTSGLAATVATYHAATAGDLTAERLAAGDVISFVHGIESSVARYGDEAVDFMTKIYAAEQVSGGGDYRPYVDALVVQEAMAYAYNCGSPTGDPAKMNCAGKPDKPLSVVHPKDGTLELDHPFVTLASATADQRAVAGDFYDFLREPEQQQTFREFGYREPEHAERPTDELVRTLAEPENQRLTFVKPPPASLLATMLASWQSVKKKVRVLLVLDVSGSMNDPVDDPNTATDPTKLQLVKPAAKQALDLLDDRDEVGLWTFSTGPPTEVLPMSSVGQVREELKGRIDGLTARGDTALFSAIEQAHHAMAANVDPERINAVVVLSDGQNTERYAGISDYGQQVQTLLSRLNPADHDSSVRIFTIPYGTNNVDVDVLTQVASVTRAVKSDASNPLDIGRAFVGVFQNFG